MYLHSAGASVTDDMEPKYQQRCVDMRSQRPIFDVKQVLPSGSCGPGAHRRCPADHHGKPSPASTGTALSRWAETTISPRQRASGPMARVPRLEGSAQSAQASVSTPNVGNPRQPAYPPRPPPQRRHGHLADVYGTCGKLRAALSGTRSTPSMTCGMSGQLRTKAHCPRRPYTGGRMAAIKKKSRDRDTAIFLTGLSLSSKPNSAQPV